MATITVTAFAITPPAGNPATATVTYTYNLACTDLECAGLGTTFNMGLELIGDDPLIDNSVGTFDAHVTVCPLNNQCTVTVNRVFVVPSATLDEDWFGKDEIRAELHATRGGAGGAPQTFTGKAGPVSGNW